MKISKSDPDKNVNKTSVSHEEADEFSPAKRLKSRIEGSSNEFAAYNEEMKVRKSNLSRISGIMVDASDDDCSAKKMSSGRHPAVHGVDNHPKFKSHACGKLDVSYEEGTSTSVQNFVMENQGARSVNKLRFHETKSQRVKSDVFDAIIKKEPSCHSHSLPKFEEGSGPNAMTVDKFSLRHPDLTGPASRDIGPSSSIANSFYRAAKTALKEATDLKHSANHLKKSGSGLESTRVFFQAALKFLHGASLLEPDHSEIRRCGEMSPSDVYSTTAKLCEYCAREYEKFNDMASAALAYKCMEVAYMRVVYYNDLAASRDRMALHMAVRAAPQDSPSSSASDIDNLNNQTAMDAEKNVNSSMEHRNHVISAGNRPNFMRLLDFTKDVNLAMEASRMSQSSFTAANPVLAQAGNEERLSCIKRVLDFSFHDVDGLLHLVRLAMDALNN
uniref:CWZF3/5/7 THD domain-containing protein n=1 Tax=Opuntia streptacantha TaxID=393608 RepID=A0A7C9AKP0_OPUST